MPQKDDDLIRIQPEKITATQQNSLFGLALIRNDLSDLVYLQSFHAKEKEKLGLNYRHTTSDVGRASGRDIYFARLALSHFWSILEFLRIRKDALKKDSQLTAILRTLRSTEQEFWNRIIQLAEQSNQKNFSDVVGIHPDVMKIIQLAYSARNDLTYHYHGTLKHISQGYGIAFSKKEFNTEFAYVTEIGDISKDRSYYIDISMQKYLEKEAVLTDSLFSVINGPFLDLFADLNKVISKILRKYHEELIK